MAFGTNTGFGFGQSNNQTSGTGFGGFGSSNTTNTGMSHFISMNFTSTWSGVHTFVLRCLASDRTKSSSNMGSGECRIWHKHKQYWLWKHCSNNKPFQRIRVKHWRYVGLSRSIAYRLLANVAPRTFPCFPVTPRKLISMDKRNENATLMVKKRAARIANLMLWKAKPSSQPLGCQTPCHTCRAAPDLDHLQDQ